MPGDRFLDELAQDGGVAFAVLRNLAEQLQATNLRLLARNSQSAGSRTGHKLAELAALAAASRSRRGAISCSTSHRAISPAGSGASRESVCRALGDFRRRGAIETGRGHIIVRDIDLLVDGADGV